MSNDWYSSNLCAAKEGPPISDQIGLNSDPTSPPSSSPYEVPTFQNTPFIEWMHKSTPRWLGRGSSDITVLLSEDAQQSEKEDYIKGLVTTSIIIFVVFVAWMIMLAIFKCLGPSRVGFLSGRRLPLPPRPKSDLNSNDDSAEQDDGEESTRLERYRSIEQSDKEIQAAVSKSMWQERYRKIKRSDRLMKAVAIIACLSIVVCSFLLTSFGTRSLLSTIDEGVDNVSIVKTLLENAVGLADATLGRVVTTETTRDELIDEMNTYCPAVREEICSDLDNVPDSCNVAGILHGNIIRNGLDFLINFRIDLVSTLENLKHDLANMLVVATELQDKAHDFEWSLYVSSIFSLALSLLILWFLFAMSFRLPRVLRCLNACILIPTFVALVTLAWIFSMTFIIGSVTLADFCYDSPDEKVLSILTSRPELFSSKIVYGGAIFYISGCPESSIPSQFASVLTNVADSIQNAQRLISLESTQAEVLCGNSHVNKQQAIALLGRLMSDVLCNSVDTWDEFHSLMECRNWFPLYENTVYDAVCTAVTDGFAWITIAQFVIVLMAMILLTFRVAFYPIEILEDEGDTEGDNSSQEGANRPRSTASSQEHRSTDIGDEQSISKRNVAGEDDSDRLSSASLHEANGINGESNNHNVGGTDATEPVLETTDLYAMSVATEENILKEAEAVSCWYLEST